MGVALYKQKASGAADTWEMRTRRLPDLPPCAVQCQALPSLTFPGSDNPPAPRSLLQEERTAFAT